MNDEMPFIEAILAAPDDEAPRLIYADWLEERGDERGQFLREWVALKGLPKGDGRRSGLETRLRKLHAEIDPQWLALIDRTRIEGCLRFEYECPRQWEQLRRTDDARTRFCDVCRKPVHYCRTVTEAQQFARLGRCVAVDSHLVRREGDVSARAPARLLGVLPIRADLGSLEESPRRTSPPPAARPPRLRPGQEVRVRRGPLKNLRGRVEEVDFATSRALVRVLRGGARTILEVDIEDIDGSGERDR
jgi:uncharacterized protein (TIGR02996 family)